VARALSNTEVAARLHLGETTVKTHLGRVLDKLGPPARDRLGLASRRGDGRRRIVMVLIPNSAGR
jgi:DNA-binding NarL/FixJ family response regulator